MPLTLYDGPERQLRLLQANSWVATHAYGALQAFFCDPTVARKVESLGAGVPAEKTHLCAASTRFSIRRTQAKSSLGACSSNSSSTLRPDVAICRSSCVFCAISSPVYMRQAITDPAGSTTCAKVEGATIAGLAAVHARSRAHTCFHQGQSKHAKLTSPARILSAGFGLAARCAP